MFKVIAVAATMVLGSTLAFGQAAGGGNTTSSQRQATPTAANSQLGKHAGDYWGKHAKDGHMTREQAMAYRGEDGKPYMGADGKGMDYTKMDTDNDGRISQSEWTGYHGAGATGGQSAGAGATGSGTTGTDKGARSGQTPRTN